MNEPTKGMVKPRTFLLPSWLLPKGGGNQTVCLQYLTGCPPPKGALPDWVICRLSSFGSNARPPECEVSPQATSQNTWADRRPAAHSVYGSNKEKPLRTTDDAPEMTGPCTLSLLSRFLTLSGMGRRRKSNAGREQYPEQSKRERESEHVCQRS